MIVSHWKLFLGLAADDPARNPNAKLPLSRRTPRPFLRVSVQPVGQSQKEFKQPFCSLPSCTKCCAATTNGDAWLELQAILTRPATAASCAWGMFEHIGVSHETPHRTPPARFGKTSAASPSMQGPKARTFLRNEFSSSCEGNGWTNIARVATAPCLADCRGPGRLASSARTANWDEGRDFDWSGIRMQQNRTRYA